MNTVFRRAQSLVHTTFLRKLDRSQLRRERSLFSNLPASQREMISIPIATYDRIPILVERTLPSLLNQSYTNIEVIVVGDGTDPELFNQLHQVKDKRLKLLRLERRTRYPADLMEMWMVAGWRPRTVGAQAALGGYIFWMSDDDLVLPGGLEALMSFSSENPIYDVVSGAYSIELDEPMLVTPSMGRSGFTNISGMPAMLCKAYTKAFRWNGKSYLKKFNRPSDYDLIERMLNQGLSFGGTDAVVAKVLPLTATQLTGSAAFAAEYGGSGGGKRSQRHSPTDSLLRFKDFKKK